MKRLKHATLRRLLIGLCLSFLLTGIAHVARAQPQSSSAQSANGATSAEQQIRNPSTVRASQPDSRYRIGPGDVLDVRIARAPELSRDAVRVDQRGMIRMPMLDVDIQAACLTEGEVAANIAKLYLMYKREPHVDVFVKEFQSQPVAVIGAVRGPAQFKLQRPVRLAELLSLAGGPTEAAGQTVQLVHAGQSSLCDQSANAEGDAAAFVSYKLSDTLRAVPEANPFVLPGDLIQVPIADQVYVLGNVLRPLAIPLKEPLTISRAIAIAGGTAPSTKKDRVRIIRQLPGSAAKQEIRIDLTAIEKNKAEDVLLMANDVVDVPASAANSILRSLVGTIVPTISQVPIRVIP
jgi:polysaccharide export outer membrane protein